MDSMRCVDVVVHQVGIRGCNASVWRYSNGLEIVDELLAILEVGFYVREKHAQVVIYNFAQVIHCCACTTNNEAKLERILMDLQRHSESRKFHQIIL